MSASPSAAHAWHWDSPRRAGLLADLSLFAGLPDDAIRIVAERARPVQSRRGGSFFRAGEPAEAVYVLASGRVKLVNVDGGSQAAILRIVGPGELFAGAGGWGGAVYPASAIAVEDAVALRLASRDFGALLGAYPAFSVALVRELAARLREAEGRIIELQTRPVEARLARALLRLAEKAGAQAGEEVQIRMTLRRRDLAELVGATIGTISRTLQVWDRRGLVRVGRERVAIREPAALADICAAPLPELPRA